MTPVVTPIYAGLLGLFLVFLSVRVIRARRSLRVALGHGDQPAVERVMRVQANFVEYVPLTLLLVALAEWQGVAPAVLHLMGLALVIGRLLHAWGVSRAPEDFRFRTAGMSLTFIAVVTASVTNLTLAVGL